MTTVQLSDTQRQILITGCARRGGWVLPLTVDLKGGAVQIVLKSLLGKGLVEEVPASSKQPVWRTTDDGAPLALKATRAAYYALGIVKARSRPKANGTAAKAPRSDTKQAMLISMLERPEGATVAEVVEATNWQPHTVRGAFAGALKKRLGLTVTSEKEEDRGRVYRVRT